MNWMPSQKVRQPTMTKVIQKVTQKWLQKVGPKVTRKRPQSESKNDSTFLVNKSLLVPF